MTLPLLSIVTPMYNEADNVETFFARLITVLSSITEAWEIICVNDGSKDNTYEQLTAWHKKEPRIKLISLSRNFGKEAALTAGIDYASGQAVIPIDADLQDPPEVIPELVAKWREGFKMVLATRKSRYEDSFIKQLTAKLFYKTIGRLATIKIPANTGDFRLIDREVVEALKQLPERNRFMKGLFAWVGYPTATIYYDRPARHRGITSWNYFKLWQFALEGITSFTTIPLQIWTYLGFGISLVSFTYAVFLVIRTLLFGIDVPGYASVMAAILFMGGVQLISLGVIGEYLSQIFKEIKQRPVYLVQDRQGF